MHIELANDHNVKASDGEGEHSKPKHKLVHRTSAQDDWGKGGGGWSSQLQIPNASDT